MNVHVPGQVGDGPEVSFFFSFFTGLALLSMPLSRSITTPIESNLLGLRPRSRPTFIHINISIDPSNLLTVNQQGFTWFVCIIAGLAAFALIGGYSAYRLMLRK